MARVNGPCRIGRSERCGRMRPPTRNRPRNRASAHVVYEIRYTTPHLIGVSGVLASRRCAPEEPMNRRASWASVITAAVSATALTLFAAPAGLASASAAKPAATLATADSASQPLRVATGDPRHPRQPRLPAPCIILGAAPSPTTAEFGTADETPPPDTGRIQAALDRCAGTGRAVVLAPGFGNGNNAFLSGPLTIGSREVLLIPGGVRVYASLNPADYQIPAQYPTNTCGTVSAAGGGCSPFIDFTGSGSGLMGTRGPNGSLGAIDGRGEGTWGGSTPRRGGL